MPELRMAKTTSPILLASTTFSHIILFTVFHSLFYAYVCTNLTLSAQIKVGWTKSFL